MDTLLLSLTAVGHTLFTSATADPSSGCDSHVSRSDDGEAVGLSLPAGARSDRTASCQKHPSARSRGAQTHPEPRTERSDQCLICSTSAVIINSSSCE